MELLIAGRCDLNARTNAGQTPRWLAHSHALAQGDGPSGVHAEIAGVLAAAGGSLGLEAAESSKARARYLREGEVRLCAEDGKRYTLDALVRTFVYDLQVYSEGECEDYFYREMQCLADDHAAWQLELPQPPG